MRLDEITGENDIWLKLRGAIITFNEDFTVISNWAKLISSTKSTHRKSILLSEIEKLENNISIFLHEINLIDNTDPDIENLINDCIKIQQEIKSIKINM
jgi:hypothetical protein